MSFNLLEFSKGGGCGCKLDPTRLRSVLSSHRKGEAGNLLVDFLHRDDAAVIELDADNCVIQTVDFFLPVVPDPYDFGRIAAANALSDVYAMGGKPIMALSLLGWPVEKLPLEAAAEIIRGAEEICKQAGITISGGHSIESMEPLFGLSVNGITARQNIKRKNTCEPGNYLYLTKPLGLGLLANGIKHEKLSEEGYRQLIEIACSLNSLGTELGSMVAVTAMTDITGFGLLGHLSEMLGENFGAELDLEKIPVIEEAKSLALQMLYPNITTGNYNYIKDRSDGLDGLEFLWLCDPQTSGGLLFSTNTELDIKGSTLIGKVNNSGRISINKTRI